MIWDTFTQDTSKMLFSAFYGRFPQATEMRSPEGIIVQTTDSPGKKHEKNRYDWLKEAFEVLSALLAL